MNMHNLVLKIAVLIFLFLGSSACRTSSYKKNMKKIADVKEEKAAEVQKQYDQAVERHESFQTKDTRKRLKGNKEKARKFNIRSGLKKRRGCDVAK